jgi:CheY-like chemotaxis protein
MMHSGTLCVHSDGEGRGCTFTLIINLIPKALIPVSSAEILVVQSELGNEVTPRRLSTTFKDIIHYSGNRKKSTIVVKPFVAPVSFNTLSTAHSSNAIAPLNTGSFLIQMNEDRRSSVFFNPLRSARDTDFSLSAQYEADDLRSLNLKILVVDDSVTSRKMLMRLLKNRCASCEAVEDGQEAVDKVRRDMELKKPVDLIIMDCNMPRLNGMDASKQMRDMGFKGVIVGLTGNVTPEDIRAFMDHGADSVLPNPLDVKMFDVVIYQLFSNT